MKDRYRREMDRLMPREEKLDELYRMVEEGGTDMKQAKWFSRKAVAAALVCAVLTVTATAAAMPAVWETLIGHLGVFAPYAQTVEGASCRDQGIKVQVLSVLSDDLQARLYFSVQDIEGDRLNEHLTLEGRLDNSIKMPPEPGEKEPIVSMISRGSVFELISYDPEAKTALFSISTKYLDGVVPAQDAHLSLTGMTTRKAEMDKTVSLASVTGAVLKSLPIGETEQTILSPSDIINLGYTDAVLPREQVVLAPEQNPMPLEGTDDMWISSMGFASDGCFHVRLGFADGISVLGANEYTWFPCSLSLDGIDSNKCWTCRETLVPGGIDILFPLFQASDLALLQSGNVRISGCYTRPGTAIEGAWDIDFQLEYYASAVLDWTGELAGRQVAQVTLSPLSVTMNSNDSGIFSTTTLYAVKQDGSTVAAEPGTGSYSNDAYGTDAGKPVWDAYNTWSFEEPVDLEEIVGLSLMGETIPVN